MKNLLLVVPLLFVVACAGLPAMSEDTARMVVAFCSDDERDWERYLESVRGVVGNLPVGEAREIYCDIRLPVAEDVLGVN